ncbi:MULTISPECIES: Crp/Fnr family transcriptional regulator [Streptomyces]|uniref:Crp/Fnr family transcriptional regulator n=1 Tax=Streptomyces TaxID=1883 RepID=UPI0004CCEE2D|nr:MULTISPECIES: Crp/Fnr family transcriptional regulator [Streptomyces]KOT60073.1 cyclic nucleotide-binding protein [Streptomyces rimosus subsp. rimosus]
MSEAYSLSAPTFSALVPHEKWAELMCHRPQTYLTGEKLLTQGDAGTKVLALVDGLVKVVRTDRDGRKWLLAFRGSGEILGEMALQCGGVRMATVLAMSTCKVFVVYAEEFQRLVREHQLALPLSEMATNRLKEQTEVREGAVHERLAVTLLRLVEVSGGRKTFSLTREDLAQHIDVGRKAVTKALERLGPDRVKAGKSRIDVISVKRLRETIGA